MILYKRDDFIRLPENTIYSRVNRQGGEFCSGLFCKTSQEPQTDWYEQDLINEPLTPVEITDGLDSWSWAIEQRDSFKQVELDYQCVTRDGMYDDEDVFLVWEERDVRKLITYLEDVVTDQSSK